MATWEWLLVGATGLVIVLLVGYAVGLVLRRRWISRHGGTFELSVRERPSANGGGWVLGVGRYTGERLEWFKIFSPVPRPARVWSRHELSYRGHRPPSEGLEHSALYAGHVVVETGTADGDLEMAMSPSALTGLQAWLEAGPPGTARVGPWSPVG